MKSFLQLLIEAIDVTKNENFKKWFGNSKVVDKEGKPLVVYHGTAASFSTFNHTAPKNYWSDEEGFFFTDRKEAANSFAEYSSFIKHGSASIGTFKDANVMPVFISAQNPYVEYVDYEPSKWIDEYYTSDFAKEVKSKGHDSVIIKEHGGEKVYVVFSPTQIKSATGNNGNFDPNNPDITK